MLKIKLLKKTPNEKINTAVYGVILQGAGSAELDDVQVFLTGSTNRIRNSGFDTGVSDWTFQGTHRPSVWTGNSLRLNAADRGDHVANHARTAFTQLDYSGWMLAGTIAGLVLTYLVPPALGLINARVASYFPYDVHICLNGRAAASGKARWISSIT